MDDKQFERNGTLWKWMEGSEMRCKTMENGWKAVERDGKYWKRDGRQ